MDSPDSLTETLGRRRLLTAAGGAALFTLAGCTQESSEQKTVGVQDTDGDGVVDSHDYAPQDASVQERADLVTEPAKRTTTSVDDSPENAPSPTPTPEPSTPSPTPTPKTPEPEPTYIVVNDVFDESHITRYSSQSLDVTLTGRDPNIDRFDDKQIAVFAASDQNRILDIVGRSETVTYTNSDTSVSVPLDLSAVPLSTRFTLVALLIPTGTEYEEISSTDSTTLHETDYVTQNNASQLERGPQPTALAELADSDSDRHSLRIKEGTIHVSITGRSQGKPFEFTYLVFKHAYLAARQRDHGRSRPEFVTYEMDNGFASFLAQMLVEDAEALGLESERSKIDFAIDVVQHYPYVPDDVSTGYDDYTKYIVELMSECGGDCEDTSILLAAVLQAEPLGYDTVLIQPPGHMGVGIKGADDLGGSYWEQGGNKYYYIETTDVGWAIGDYPDELEDRAYVHQV